MNIAADYLHICIAKQCLTLIENGEIKQSYPVSTAKNGPGEINGSGCTPRGWHCVRAKIGQNSPIGTVFVARRATGEVYSERLAEQQPHRDWILSRILWLGGAEPGFNRFGTVDTGKRYIYIHGSPDSGVDGTPQSHGCIRMKNRDILYLFDRVGLRTRVLID